MDRMGVYRRQVLVMEDGSGRCGRVFGFGRWVGFLRGRYLYILPVPLFFFFFWVDDIMGFVINGDYFLFIFLEILGGMEAMDIGRWR
jgi:hypothetical protein